eukprot:GHVU01051262.1.p1 GENE.GHVU01051262.1~~GHVU01051262.1.p1  ORF type:complete len:144 (+),score=3.34 GHVU01051262.1:137-568(+)
MFGNLSKLFTRLASPAKSLNWVSSATKTDTEAGTRLLSNSGRSFLGSVPQLCHSLSVRCLSYCHALSSNPKRTVLGCLLGHTPNMRLPTIVPSQTYKVRTALKKRCDGCYFVTRKGRLYVECKLKQRHKQMQKMSKRKLYRED